MSCQSAFQQYLCLFIKAVSYKAHVNSYYSSKELNASVMHVLYYIITCILKYAILKMSYLLYKKKKTFQESFLADSFLSMVQYARDNKEATAAGLLSMVKQCDGKWEILYQIPKRPMPHQIFQYFLIPT